MTVGELLDGVRAHYVGAFAREVSDRAFEPGVEIIVEPALVDAEGHEVSEGALDLPLRNDFALVCNGTSAEILRFELATQLAFEPVSFSWGSMTIHLHAFEWNQCSIATTPRLELFAPLQSWFRRWFRPEEESAGLLGVIHFLSDPQSDEARSSLEVDLGSAPVEAFEELLDALADCGAREVFVGAP